jgi:DNA modification methylase
MARKRTATSNFGVGARESHDATGFYERFRAPIISRDEELGEVPDLADPLICGDARDMHQLPDCSVALVVTSPPYFAGKQYEEELEREGVPSSYLDYLTMLTEVFTECVRVLEPGGRIAVNVANLGRRPYRSLSADVIRILENDLGLLLRGEVIWRKAGGANGSCAWGSFRSATNPVLRDVSERIIIASKGRFDRARDPKRRAAEGRPHISTVSAEDFMAMTLDVWEIPPESAQRVGHPAPFPVELPEQLITLLTYEDDLVLDPFMGSGSTIVAAARTGRRYVGYDLDPTYVEIARERLLTEGHASDHDAQRGAAAMMPVSDPGAAGHRVIEECLLNAGFSITQRNFKVRGTGVVIPFEVTSPAGTRLWCEVGGPHRRHRGGLSRTEQVLRVLGRAAVVRQARGATALVILTTQLPVARSEAATMLTAALADPQHRVIDQVIDVSDPQSLTTLRMLADPAGSR